MIKLLQTIWARVTAILCPQDYYSWQTLIYLGIFSFVMSWVARLALTSDVTVNLIATAGWIFFALGIGWLLEDAKVRFLGMPVAPWAVGAIVCTYFFGLVPWDNRWQLALMSWPLVSVAIAIIPEFLTWELRPKIPPPAVRQKLILLSLMALLFSNWFQFYFRLQDWFAEYPSLLADDFGRSGFVFRLSNAPSGQAQGIMLLTTAETEITAALNDTPWSYVERWLLNLDEQVGNLQSDTLNSLDLAAEKDLWRLAAQPRRLPTGGYALDLMAIWSGPASTQEGYYLAKTCVIQPRSQTEPAPNGEVNAGQTNQVAQVECDLATPRYPGQPVEG